VVVITCVAGLAACQLQGVWGSWGPPQPGVYSRSTQAQPCVGGIDRDREPSSTLLGFD
jgi:hypothetical protein